MASDLPAAFRSVAACGGDSPKKGVTLFLPRSLSPLASPRHSHYAQDVEAERTWPESESVEAIRGRVSLHTLHRQLEVLTGQVVHLAEEQAKTKDTIGSVEQGVSNLLAGSMKPDAVAWKTPLPMTTLFSPARALGSSLKSGDEEDDVPDTPTLVSHEQTLLEGSTRTISNNGAGPQLAQPEMDGCRHMQHSEDSRLHQLLMRADTKKDTDEARKTERAEMQQSLSSLEIIAGNFRAASKPGGSLEKRMEVFMGMVICLNTIQIGVSCDIDPTWLGWFWFDLGFCATFVIEIVFRMLAFGFRYTFLGPGSTWNIFDCIVIVLESAKIGFELASVSVEDQDSGGVSFSVFRVLRMVRLTRILRVFRIKLFKDLLEMVHGLLGGMRTLGWSFVLVVVPLYGASLLMRTWVGHSRSEEVSIYFETVPRSMLTMFRCAFGDCSTTVGGPLFELVVNAFGWPFAVFYTGFIFVMTLGLFNVITAIFVENVVRAAMANEVGEKHKRLSDEDLLASSISLLVSTIFDHMGREQFACKSPFSRLSQSVAIMADLEVSADLFNRVIADPIAIEALDSLDISKEDHTCLFDVLDSDNNGTMHFAEFIAGIEKLRGEPRRSDIVAVDLMLRSVQQEVHQTNQMVKNLLSNASLPRDVDEAAASLWAISPPSK